MDLIINAGFCLLESRVIPKIAGKHQNKNRHGKDSQKREVFNFILIILWIIYADEFNVVDQRGFIADFVLVSDQSESKVRRYDNFCSVTDFKQ